MEYNPWQFTQEEFQAAFPEFSALTEAQFSLQKELGPEYISIQKYWGRSPYATQTAIAMLVLAHLAQLASNGAGATAGPMTGATEGSTSVSFSAPAGTSSSAFWCLTGYGQIIWAMIRSRLTPRMVDGAGRIIC